MSAPPRLGCLLATAVGLAGLLGPVAAASASTYDPVASGQTTLTLAAPFLRELRSHGVRLAAAAPATLKGASASFPVGAGRLDPVDAIGTAESEGALVFAAGGRKLPMKEPQLKTSRRSSPLAAKFGGGKLKLASSSHLATARQGFGFAATVTQIRLSPGVATRLDKKLGLGRLLKGGELFGKARTEALPETVAILGQGRVSVELAAAFQAKLASVFVATNPIFPAEHPGPFTFPIAGGHLAPDGSSGALQGGGAIEFLELGGGQVIMREPEVELGPAAALSTESELLPSPPYPGKLGRAPALDLGGGSLSSEPAARAIGLSGAGLALTAATAAQLNEAFARPQGKSDLFAAGEALGTLSFQALGE
jgi:hypothetical protein